MPALRAVAPRTVLLPAMVVAVLAACSSDSVTRPQPSGNVALMARFDSVLTGLNPATQSVRRTQLTELISLLAVGGSVQRITFTLDGTTATYSAVGGFEVVDDIEGHPADSVYVLLAWRGDRADTLASLAVFHGLADASLTTADSVFESTAGSAAGTVTAAPPNGACTSYLDHLPPGIIVPPGLRCQLQTATPSFDAVVRAGAAPSVTHHLTVPSQPVAGIRVEGQTGG